jgi:Fe-S-cluster-containing dehydrogenase component/formate-dependent nitrite reductase membrane component NrfD
VSVRYGFVIDNRKCIGCHACSVACKAENHVPLGVFRTWVRCVDSGQFPDTRRHFQVTRCNHCDNPPCVAVCPVAAMYRRRDGIVDFDPSRCIGCKACMQACPYDAVYIDPERATAAKCHFCAHRVEAGMQPACVVACPEQAIVAGDLDDPASEISRLIDEEPVTVRRPDKQTRPKLFYVGAEEAAIVPGRARNVGTYLFATVNTEARRVPLPAERGSSRGPTVPAIVSYDVEHIRAWDWQVPAYFWTKSVSTGILAVPALALATEGLTIGTRLETVLGLTGVVFLALTVVLLISDLSRPGRFFRVLTHPQPRSWVARGAFLLLAYGVLSTCFFLSSWAGAGGVASVLLWPTVVAGLLAAVYTAFLFGQCKGRDLWQTRLLPPHLVAQWVLASSAVLTLLPGSLGVTPRLRHVAVVGLALGLLAHGLMVLGELAMPHATDAARRAASIVTRGSLRDTFWIGAFGAGWLLPAALLAADRNSPLVVGIAGAGVLAGLLAFEWCFVMAAQGVPNS